LLAAYVEAAARRREAAANIKAQGAVLTDGKLNPWCAIEAAAVKTLAILALRLRLSPQARRNAKPDQKVEMSYYERMALEGDV